MPRAILIVMDSVGIGGAPDAENYGDLGSNTIGHIAQASIADNSPIAKKLEVPNLSKLGLFNIYNDLHAAIPGFLPAENPTATYGYAIEESKGKDTLSGHWEIAGVPVYFDWGYYRKQENSFPSELLDKIVKKANLTGYLGNCHASGTTILEQLGDEHRRTKKPIFYTSADSVFQVACHETDFGLDKLYDLCEILRAELYKDKIGRIIARPFIGTEKAEYKRTGNRRDYSMSPPQETMLNVIQKHHGDVVAIGKMDDIYSHSGTTEVVHATGLEELIDKTLLSISGQESAAPSLILTNLVDFDSAYGHRRDPAGYAQALEYFDSRLPDLQASLRADDLLVLTADHGNDPTWTGTDHTRENIPILAYQKNKKAKNIGGRKSFADIGQSIISHLGLADLEHGKSFL